MKKRLFAAGLALCLLCSIALCGCSRKSHRAEFHYDNAPLEAYTYEVKGDEAIVTGFTATNTVANIPEELDGKPVTTVKAGAFKDVTTLETINLPPTMTTVENEAFSGCTNLRSLSLPPTLTTIGDSAFAGCVNLTIANFPYVLNYIGNKAFAGCTALKTISFSCEATIIGADAFADTPWFADRTEEFATQCGSLLKYNGTAKDVTVPDGVTVISSAFAGNTTVTTVVLPESVTTLTADAFAGCTALSEITIPASVKAIDDAAFTGCDALATVKGKAGSAAATFAETAGVEFVEI